MKKILLATTLLAATTGFAAAEVTLSGDARMGIISNFDDAVTLTTDENDLQFTSRARVKFTLSGSTDGGLEFGASFRADNAVGAKAGQAGAVFISGAFGKLSMGDVDDAANSAVGQVSGVGLTGLGDLNEVSYIGGGDDPTALYEYSTGDLTIYASVTNPTLAVSPASNTVAYSVAAKYALGDYTVALGYEDNDAGSTHIIAGASATFGAATVKAIYGTADGIIDGDQYAVSVDYTADALTVTAFYSSLDLVGVGGVVRDAYGVGASYDLGDNASVVGGYSFNDTTTHGSYDLGVSMSF